jgi:hypothetical protein
VNIRDAFMAAKQAAETRGMPQVVMPTLLPPDSQAPGLMPAFAEALRHQTNPQSFAAVKRIAQLEIRPGITEAEIEELSKDTLLRQAYLDGFRLKAPQAAAVREWRAHGCFFGPIGVGRGKTLIGSWLANDIYTRLGQERMILSLPSSIYQQFTQVDLRWLRTKIPLAVPFHLLGHPRSRAQRLALAKSKRRGCYICRTRSTAGRTPRSCSG